MPLIKPPHEQPKKYALTAAICLVVYAAIGFLLIPWLIRWQTPVQIQKHLGRESSLEKAAFNPFTLELNLHGFTLLEHNDQSFVSFDRLYVNYGLWDSLTHLSAAVQEIALEAPYVHVDRLPEGKFNFSDLAKSAKEPEPEKEEKEGLFPVWIGRLAIQNGQVKFEDHALKPGFQEEIQHLNLQITGLSTKKDAVTPYHLELALASGGKLAINGETVLDPLSAQGALDFSGFGLNKIQAYLKDSGIQLQQGVLTVAANYGFDGGAPEKIRFNLSQGNLSIENLQLATTKGGKMQLEIPRFEVTGVGVESVTQPQKQATDLKIGQIQLTGQTLTLSRPKEPNLFINTGLVALNHLAMTMEKSDDPAREVMILTNQALKIKDTRIGGSTTAGKPVIMIPETSAEKLAVDLKKQTVDLESLSSSQATIEAWLAKGGELNLQTLFAGNAPKETGEQTRPDTDKSGATWAVQVHHISLDNYQFDLEDKNTRPAARFSLRPIRLTLDNFSTTPGNPVQLAMDITINEKGTFSAKGPIVIDPLKLKLDLNANRFALGALQPYISQFAKLHLKKGDFHLAGKLDLALDKSGKPVGGFRGDTGIARLHTVDTAEQKDFLKWRALDVNGLALNFAPMKVSIRTVVSDGLYNRFIIHKDKTTNLDDIFPKQPAKSPKSAPTQKNGPPLPLAIGSVKIKNAAALFSDQSLVLPFVLNMGQLNGAIDNISTRANHIAKVDIQGKVNRMAPVLIAGSLKPFDIENFLDIQLKVEDADLTAVTPYMAHFAGYAIEKGKITLDVAYKIQDKKLEAQNQVVINQLTLGDKIDSPEAVSLPVKLAIGLLQDQNGVIDLNLPLTGSLEDPKFSIGRLIGQVLLNLLTKAATSPFSLIGGLVSSGGEDPGKISFPLGSAALSHQEAQKLVKIGRALQARPKLVVEVKGIALDPADRQAMAENRLLARMRMEKWDDIEGEEGAPAGPGAIQLSNQEIQDFLVKYYLDDVEDAQDPEPVKTGSGEEVIPQAYYKKAKQKLLEQIPVTDLDLQQLARNRATAIVHYLTQQGKLPASRVFVLQEDIQKQAPSEGENKVALELKLTVP
ncbi:MAG: hypothetical protein AXA67_10800 [Methylothermaceae bacteria B42]|nr:MAG: hypothetical protein AXA67_10800 [Methylothermaceae bacteria B42]HHJ38965.1 DUF748 domain-containing protein [Methylothermaceae bacterium]